MAYTLGLYLYLFVASGVAGNGAAWLGPLGPVHEKALFADVDFAAHYDSKNRIPNCKSIVVVSGSLPRLPRPNGSSTSRKRG
jgi:hypothetical protein